jgi:hypothetical protein
LPVGSLKAMKLRTWRARLPECGKYWRTGARSSSAESPK